LIRYQLATANGSYSLISTPLRLERLVAPTGTAICTADCGLCRVRVTASQCCRMRSSARQLGDGLSGCIALSIFFPLYSSFPAKRVLIIVFQSINSVSRICMPVLCTYIRVHLL